MGDPRQFNRYAYDRNNPFAFIDPKGEAIELVGTDVRSETLRAFTEAEYRKI